MKVSRTYNLTKYAKAAGNKFMPQMINDIAALIQKDIIYGVGKGKNLDDSNTAKLDPKTIKAKKSAGHPFPSLPRVATGAMSSIGGPGGPYISQDAKPGKLVAILRSSQKAFYGMYQHTDRPWWGIAPRTEKDVDKIIKVKTVQALKAAHTGGLK